MRTDLNVSDKTFHSQLGSWAGMEKLRAMKMYLILNF